MCSLASWVIRNGEKKIVALISLPKLSALHILDKKILMRPDLGLCLQVGKTHLKCSLLFSTKFFTIVEQLWVFLASFLEEVTLGTFIWS